MTVACSLLNVLCNSNSLYILCISAILKKLKCEEISNLFFFDLPNVTIEKQFQKFLGKNLVGIFLTRTIF